MNIKRPCGRLGRHLGHHWRGAKLWEEWADGRGRWVKPVYFCTGYIQIEGGHRGVR